MISNLARYLAGQRLQGAETTSPVKQVYKRGEFRTVEHQDGTRTTYTKRQLMNRFNSTLQTNQAKLALKSIKRMEDHTARVTLGGSQRGERKTYVSVPAAKAAVKRRYPKAKI